MGANHFRGPHEKAFVHGANQVPEPIGCSLAELEVRLSTCIQVRKWKTPSGNRRCRGAKKLKAGNSKFAIQGSEAAPGWHSSPDRSGHYSPSCIRQRSGALTFVMRQPSGIFLWWIAER